jgi:hypothetical protein
MAKLNREKILSIPGLFILYVFFSSLLILIFRLVFPGEAAPLERFSTVWRFLRAAEDIIILFPCLVLSALVFPFGFNYSPPERFTSFSPKFLKKLSPSVLCSIAGAVIYVVLFLLALPLVLNSKTNLQSQARLYRLSMEQAFISANEGDWEEVSGFLAICERIWPRSPELSGLTVEASFRLQELAMRPVQPNRQPGRQDLSASVQLTVSDALALAEIAMNEERYYDAHWLATLAGDLAGPGSIESATASRIASRAWNAVSSMQPNSRESQAYRIYTLKRDAYRDLVAGEYISAYYIFLELLSLAPNDPEGSYYLALCERGLSEISFFIDEMELRDSPSGGLYSFPFGLGRMVMRFTSLSVFPDSAYGIRLEMLNFDRDGRLLWRMEAPYAKIVPVSLDSGRHISIMMRALDRNDGSRRWEPVKEGFAEAPPQNDQITLNIIWEDFLLLTEIRRGQDSLTPGELMAASSLGSQFGYIPSIFDAELISRFAEPILLLPFFIFAIVLGWRFRAVRRSRFIWVPMLGVLPVVFAELVHLGRISVNNMSIWAVMNFGFSAAVFAFVTGTVVLLFLSLIILASQRG